MYLSFGMPFGYFSGQLPINVHLEIKNILFSEASTALKVMAFDMQLAVATSYNPANATAGAGTSAWAFVRDYELPTNTMHYCSTDVFVVAKAVYAAAARGDVIVMGEVTALPKVGSAQHALGQQLIPSTATVGTVAPMGATAGAGTLSTTATIRKVVALCTNAATAATANVHFNGFGWGFVFKNGAYNAD